VPANTDAWFGLAEARRRLGRFDQAIAARHQAYVLGDAPRELLVTCAQAKGPAGYDRIDNTAARLEIHASEAAAARGEYVPALELARASARAGDRDRAFDQLDAAFEERSPGLVFLKIDSAWDRVRDDPRFKAAVDAMDFP